MGRYRLHSLQWFMLWSTKLSIKEHKNLSLDPELTETLANHYERRALVEAVWTRQVALPVSLAFWRLKEQPALPTEGQAVLLRG